MKHAEIDQWMYIYKFLTLGANLIQEDFSSHLTLEHSKMALNNSVLQILGIKFNTQFKCWYILQHYMTMLFTKFYYNNCYAVTSQHEMILV